MCSSDLPDLDLWATAKPYLERWMSEQTGWRALVKSVQDEAPFWAGTLPQLPRLIHRALAEDTVAPLQQQLARLREEHQRLQASLRWLLGLFAVSVAAAALIFFR